MQLSIPALLLPLFIASTWSSPINVKQKIPATSRIPASHYGERLIGGNNANVAEFPYVAAITYTTSTGSYFCGGALLNNRWIITAGNCVFGATTFTIELGTNRLNESNVRVTASTHALPPNFDGDNFRNDLGMIQLRMPITFSDFIQQIYLPTHSLDSYSSMSAVGWGQTNVAQPGLVNDLQVTTLISLPQSECLQAYGPGIGAEIVCVAGPDIEGICNGDHGSPLVLFQHRYPAWIVGVASFYSNQGCGTPDPSGYTRVFPFLTWINTQLSS